MLTAALFLLAAADPPAPPPVLAPYLHDGTFDPGDYRWARGRFDDAGPAEKAEFETVATWLRACTESGVKQAQSELAAMGVHESKIEHPSMRDPVCAQVASIAFAGSAHSFPEFQRAVAEARPLADTYLFAVAMAEKAAQPYDDTLAARIQARPLGEQMLRNAASWGQGEAGAAPAVSPEARANRARGSSGCRTRRGRARSGRGL
ncbi:MAG: hypothetical protein V4574_09975 [Pseudomonadota bacterium]